jgi:hypothetical protein
MRRNDFDVTDKIRTTDPIDVGDEVMRLFQEVYQGRASSRIERAFRDMSTMYHGKHRDYHPCDTEYHDIQHVLDVTLAMARLLAGYERGREGYAPLPAAYFTVGIITTLFHDVGYLRRRHDRMHRFGAEYTLIHVTRGSCFLRDYLPRAGLTRYAKAASQLVHFTGYERDLDTIRVDDPLLRRVGEMIGTADIIAQMSDRCYLEKVRERLYPEFVLGGVARRKLPGGKTTVVFESADDLVRKTPGFFRNAAKRLDEKLHRAYAYAERYFGGQNLYLEEMNKNVKHAAAAANTSSHRLLRRTPPSTLEPSVRAHPDDLVIY